MDFIKKLNKWIIELDEFHLEKKKMRREDRLGEVNYQAFQNNDEEKRLKQSEVAQGGKL